MSIPYPYDENSQHEDSLVILTPHLLIFRSPSKGFLRERLDCVKCQGVHFSLSEDIVRYDRQVAFRFHHLVDFIEGAFQRMLEILIIPDVTDLIRIITISRI